MRFLNQWLPLLIFTTVCLTMILSLPGKFSSVYNEYGRLASGQINLESGDFSPFHVNPPLPNMIGSLPSVMLNAEYATPADLGYSHFGRSEYKANDVFIKKNPNHRDLLTYGRIASSGLILLGLVFCCHWAYQLTASICLATMTGILWLFSPYIIGHGTLVSPDVPSAALAVASVYFFWRWLKRPDMFETFIAGIVLGLAELTKFTLLIFYPLFLILWLIYKLPEFKTLTKNDWLQQTKQLTVMFAVSILIINMGYLFEGTGKQLGSFKFQTTFLTGCEKLENVPRTGGNRFESTLLGYIPMPLPSNYIQGIDTQRLDFERGLPSYLRGEWSDHGWWHYYLYALLIKTPLGTIGLFLLAIFCTFFQKGYNVIWRDEMVILLPGIVLLVFVSSQTGFSVHSRYIIPVLPFFIIWMSKVGKAFTLKRPVVATLATILLTWSVASSLWVYPHSISYFNELAAVLPTPEDKNYPKPVETQKTFWQKTKYALNTGPRNGPRHLLDSNIDWGQDLFYLEHWCRDNPHVKEIKVASWGGYPLELTTIPSTGIPPANDPQPGWFALSVNYLYDREKQYRYFLNYEPVATAGYSIYIYHITPDEANRVRREMGLPEIEGADEIKEVVHE